MKAKSREVNIFNLSMLDVLSGALAAVLIIMIALAGRPAETPPPSEGDVTQEEYDRVKKELEDAKKKNKDMEVRRPVVVNAMWLEKVNVDIYVQDFTKRMQAMPPTIDKRQWPVWPGDVAYGYSAGGNEVWMMRDMPAGPYKVYSKLMANSPAGASAVVYLGILYESISFSLGSVVHTAQDPIIHAATLTMDDNGKLRVQPQPKLNVDDQLKKYMSTQ